VAGGEKPTHFFFDKGAKMHKIDGKKKGGNIQMKKITRRSFIKKGLTIGAASLFGGGIISNLSGNGWGVVRAAEAIDLSIVKGSNYFQNTIKAVEQLGGMKKFVSRNAKVGLLVNWPFKNYGAHVNPEIALAVIKMCYDAGAKDIIRFKEEHGKYWQRSTLANEFAEEIKSLKVGWKDTIDYKIPKAIKLKEPTIRKDLLECDVFINVAISKNHSGTDFSCMLKNMMGTTTTMTNMYFHFGGKKGLSWYADLNHLSQCIADLNLVRKPDLSIADSTEFIITNGPSGPGKLLKPQKVVAGTDCVLVDAYCSTSLNLKAEKVEMIKRAAAHNIGRTDLQKANILEMEL
jgi:uncharacterized protein (DUF362 family)